MNNSSTNRPATIYGLDQIDHSQIRDSWILPQSVIRKLHCYHLLYWRKDFLTANNALAPNVVISRNGLQFITILTCPVTEFNSCSRVAMSFRHAFGHKFGYVLISPAVKYGTGANVGGYSEN